MLDLWLDRPGGANLRALERPAAGARTSWHALAASAGDGGGVLDLGGGKDVPLFAAIALAGTVAAGTPPETVRAAGLDQEDAQGIVVPSGTRIKGGSVLSERIDTHRCPSNVVVIRMVMTGGGRIIRVTIDGRPIPGRRLAAINAVLATFERPPEVYVNCYPTSHSLTLRQVESARATREEHVDLLLPADR